MIDLKRNSKQELVRATGKRSRASSIYSPNQHGDFKISRGKFSDFLVCNADREASGFNGEMKFQEVLIPYQWNSDWIYGRVTEMIELMNNGVTPDANPSCKNCAYAYQRASLERVN